MKGLRKYGIGAAVVLGIAGSYQIGTKNPPRESLTKQARWVAYSPTNITRGKAYQNQAAVAKATGAKIDRQLSHINGYTFKASKAEVAKMRTAIASTPQRWRIVEDRVYKVNILPGCRRKPTPEPTPTEGPTPPPTEAQVPWGVTQVQGLKAQAIENASGVTVCVLDTGTDREHPDIAPMLVGGASFVDGASWDDDHGHGTHVAGIISAQLNDRDVVGVSQAKIYTGKVLDFSGSGFGSWIASGVFGCVYAGAEVINMSLGSLAEFGPDPLISDALNWAMGKGVRVVAAAGNDGGPTNWPAAQRGVYAISATNAADELASFSSRGPEISYAAPGVNITSLQMGGGVVTWSGTSMATPHAAAAMAMAIAAGKGSIGVDDIRLPEEHQGAGRVNAYKSVQ